MYWPRRLLPETRVHPAIATPTVYRIAVGAVDGMTLTEIATTDVVTASADSGLREVVEQLDSERVGSVVITDGDEPVGIVTDRMIAMALREIDDLDDATAADVMTEDVVTVSDDTTHFEVLETMRQEGIRRVPIVDDGALTGIITLDDLLVVAAAELGNVSDIVEQQASRL